MVRIIDLTHLIEPAMPVYPGTEPPILQPANTVARDGFAEKKLILYSHTGTHMDAPAHMLSGGRTLDSYPVTEFYGRAVMADFSGSTIERVTLENLLPLQARLQSARFFILRTGWAERWGQPGYFTGFPALAPEAARWLVSLGVRGVGTDAISVDRMEDHTFPVHHALFAAGLFVIENLANLHRLGNEFTLGCFPLQIQDADGAPARVVAWSED